MHGNTRRTVAAFAVITTVAAGGSAVSGSNIVPAAIAGHGSPPIHGADATALHYTLSADGTTVTAATLTLPGDKTGRTVKAAFGTDALTECTLGTFDPVSDTTPAICSGYTQSAATATSFNVTVG